MASGSSGISSMRVRPSRTASVMLRVAGSLITHQVRGYDVLAMLGRDGRPTPLGQGFIEYGRIAKTLHLLAMIDPVDDTHRRAVNTQTTVQESRHRLARKIFHGNRGALYQRYREGRARKTSWGRWASCSTPPRCGTPAISTPPYTNSASAVIRSARTTWSACPRSGTPTSMSWAATASRC